VFLKTGPACKEPDGTRLIPASEVRSENTAPGRFRRSGNKKARDLAGLGRKNGNP